MVRTCCLSFFDVAVTAVLMAALLVFLCLVAVACLAIAARRSWRELLCALCLVAAIGALVSCAAPPAPVPANAPREPEIFRPVNPRYPLPS